MRHILLLTLLLSSFLFSKEIFGEITYLKGDVTLNNKLITTPQTLYIKDVIQTKNNGKVKILQTNGSIIKIGRDSILKLSSFDEVEQPKGNSYFKVLKGITKFNSKFKMKIKMKSASIGIRGTNFVVNNSDIESILLRKGQLEIIANENKFKVFKEKQKDESFDQDFQDEFSSFDTELEDEFNSFTKEITYEFDQFTKSMQMNEKEVISINNKNELYAKSLTELDLEKAFKEFDGF